MECLIAVDNILQQTKPEERNGQSSESKDKNGKRKSQPDLGAEDRFDTRNQELLWEQVESVGRFHCTVHPKCLSGSPFSRLT